MQARNFVHTAPVYPSLMGIWWPGVMWGGRSPSYNFNAWVPGKANVNCT